VIECGGAGYLATQSAGDGKDKNKKKRSGLFSTGSKQPSKYISKY
jgi:hypothetical protein